MNEFEKALQESKKIPQGNGAKVKEGLQLVTIKSLDWPRDKQGSIRTFKGAEYTLDIIAAPADYSEWDIRKRIFSGYNRKTGFKSSVWKARFLIESMGGDFDSYYNPNDMYRFYPEKIKKLSEWVAQNKPVVTGILFEGNSKPNERQLYWEVYDGFLPAETTDDDRDDLMKKYQDWKQNDMVRKKWTFKEDLIDDNIVEETPVTETAGMTAPPF